MALGGRVDDEISSYVQQPHVRCSNDLPHRAMAGVVCGSGAVTVITLMIVSTGGRMRVYRLSGSFMRGAVRPVCDIP